MSDDGGLGARAATSPEAASIRLRAQRGGEVPRGCRLPSPIPLRAAPVRCLKCNLLILLGLGFFFEPEGRGFAEWPSATERLASFARPRIPPGAPVNPRPERHFRRRRFRPGPYRAVPGRGRNRRRRGRLRSVVESQPLPGRRSKSCPVIPNPKQKPKPNRSWRHGPLRFRFRKPKSLLKRPLAFRRPLTCWVASGIRTFD